MPRKKTVSARVAEASRQLDELHSIPIENPSLLVKYRQNITVPAQWVPVQGIRAENIGQIPPENIVGLDRYITDSVKKIDGGDIDVAEGTVIKIRRGLSSTWNSLNPVLESGELGLENDTRKVKIGDGLTAWRDLSYGIGQVGNINIEGNTISSTDTNGSITLQPNGSGGVYVGSDLFVTGDVYSQTNKKLATVEYVDSVSQGLDVKESVRAASVETLVLEGLQNIDGVDLEDGDRVLVKDQSETSENGIYIVSPGAWERSDDANSDSDVTSGLFTFVEEGETNANSGWVLSTPRPISLGSTGLNFSQFSGAGQISVAGGLEKYGNEIRVGTADSSRIVINPNDIDLAMTGVEPGEYTKVMVDEYGRITQGANWSSSEITALGTVTSGTWRASVIDPQYGGTGVSSQSSKVSIRSPVVDFLQIGDVEVFTVPSGCVFSIDSMEVITTSISDPGEAPTVRFGSEYDFETYYLSQATTSNYQGARHIIENAQNLIFEGSQITFGVTAPSGATEHSGYAIISGVLVKIN